jgi:C-terminal processing protease CtpA/Prc
MPVLPDIDKLLERLPPGTDEAQIKELRKRLERMRQQIERQADLLQKQLERHANVIGKQMEMQADMMRRQMEMMRNFRLLRPADTQGERLGAQVQVPEPALAAQLDLPKDQGLVLKDIAPNSAAAKAGLKPHDILLELNGKPVPSRVEDFAGLLKEVKPGTPINVVVLRKGKKETIKGLSLPDAKTGQPGRKGGKTSILGGDGIDIFGR